MPVPVLKRNCALSVLLKKNRTVRANLVSIMRLFSKRRGSVLCGKTRTTQSALCPPVSVCFLARPLRVFGLDDFPRSNAFSFVTFTIRLIVSENILFAVLFNKTLYCARLPTRRPDGFHDNNNIITAGRSSVDDGRL